MSVSKCVRMYRFFYYKRAKVVKSLTNTQFRTKSMEFSVRISIEKLIFNQNLILIYKMPLFLYDNIFFYTFNRMPHLERLASVAVVQN